MLGFLTGCILTTFLFVTFILRRKSVPAASRLLMSQHESIFRSIREKKPQAARSAAETHIDFVRETLAQTLRSVARRETAERRLAAEY